MLLSQTLNNNINNLHERALNLVYNDKTSSFLDLLNIDKSFTIDDRNLQSIAIEMYKIEKKTPSFMRSYQLRNMQTYQTENMCTDTYRGHITCALVPDNIKKVRKLTDI